MKVIIVTDSQGRIAGVCALNTDVTAQAVGILTPLADLVECKLRVLTASTLGEIAEYLKEEAKDA